MDSKGIYRKSYSGKPGAKRSKYPKRKVYCIIEKGEYIYFPIAAQYSPYCLYENKEKKDSESFLAGMPNFFGGNMEGRETIEAALMREIREESQGKIVFEIPAGALGTPVFEYPAGTDHSEQNTYKFYVLKVENCAIKNFEWESGDVIPLRSFEESPVESMKDCAQYEDSFLVRMEKERFRSFINGLVKLNIEKKKLEGKELEEVKEKVHGLLIEFGITPIATKTGINNWYYISHTSTAFANSIIM